MTRWTYDAEADAAYLYVTEGEDVADTVPGEGAAEGVNLDFSADGRLVGIEVTDASRVLPQSIIEEADES